MAKKKASLKTCRCIELANKELAKLNAELVTGLQIDFASGQSRSLIAIPLRRADSNKRGKLPEMYCTYCPICGTKLL